MQKKLIALALASAFAAPAFAATSNVDIYGSINESIERVDNGLATYNRMVTNNNSFLGFKGSEDLGGGLKAVWQLETNVSFDGNGAAANTTTGLGSVNSNLFGTRNTYIGLAGGFGTVIAGVNDTPYKMSTGPLDQFVGTLGDYNAVFGSAGAVASNSGLFDLRTANTIAYLSPNFSGFDFKAAYVMGLEGQTTGTNSRANAYSLSGTYNNGPLFATAAYEKHNNVGTTACNVGAVCLGQGTNDQDAWKIGAGYTIGAFKVGALYEKMGDNYAATSGSKINHSAWMLNGAYNIGAVTLKASYTKAGEINNVANSGAKMYAFGADYALSKRTVVQAVYAKMDNESAASWDLGQGPTVGNAGTTTATGLGQAVSGFGLGIKHAF